MPPDDDSFPHIEALEKRVAELEKELAAARVQQALLDERLLILERNRLFRLWNGLYRKVAPFLGKNRGGISDLRTPGDYDRWISHEQYRLEAEDHAAAISRWRSRPLISVVLESDSPASLESLSAQWYTNWKVCRTPPENGDFHLVLHPGDRLAPSALYFYAQALQHDDAGMLYADEDFTDVDGHRSHPIFKPGWSPELIASTKYLGRAVLSQTRDGSVPGRHIPRVLYHRASAPESPAQVRVSPGVAPSGARLAIVICSRSARQVRECLEAVRSTAALPLEIVLVHHLDSVDGEEMRGVAAHFSAAWLPYRGPFDFARMNNLGASKATAPILLFLNDDVMVRKKGWDQMFAETLSRAEIGIAGAVLDFPNGTIQHAGVVSGMGDAVGHCGRFQKSSELWPWLRMSRDVSAVTGAMLGIRSDQFREMGGFDERFPVNYNDVDLCFRVREAGLRVVCLNAGEVIHRESRTRMAGTRHHERDALYRRWSARLARDDEFYSPHLAPVERIALRIDDTLPLSGLVATR